MARLVDLPRSDKRAIGGRAMAEDPVFAMTGLVSRGGLSNWVFFFSPDEVVMIDVGAMPAIMAGIKAGILGFDYRPKVDPTRSLQAWSTELRSKARDVVVLKHDQIRILRLRMKMTSHELLITGADGKEKKFGLMDREQAVIMTEPLMRSFGPKFEVSKTPMFQFFARYAPFLTS